MSGSLARKGFRFQDLYLLHRVLIEAANRFMSRIDESGVAQRGPEPRFGIEATTSIGGKSPDWDIIIAYHDQLEVIEAKSGSISKSDRVAFWKRLRREGQFSKADNDVRAALAFDPMAEDRAKWAELAMTASSAPSNTSTRQEPTRVLVAADLLAEALWWMCDASESEAGSPALPLEKAYAILRSFTPVSIASDDLDSRVLRDIEVLFPNGLSDQVCDAVLGWLNRRATDQMKQRRFFSLSELLGEMNILQDCVALGQGTLERWKTLWRELPALFDQRARSCLGSTGESISIAEAQPKIQQALAMRDENFVIVGNAGGGKTGLLSRFGVDAQGMKAEVFRCNADAVSEQEVPDLLTSLRFKAALLKVRAPQKKMCVLVDALDEAEPPLRTIWTQQLARFGTNARTTTVVTIRDNAWRSDGISQRQLQHWQELLVEEWSEELVLRLLSPRWPKDRISGGLLQLLRQPLMLDVFWRTFIEGDENNTRDRSVPQTRHQLLSAFWQERLLHSKRHKVPNLKQKIETVVAHASAAVGSFDAQSDDGEALGVLLSESVIIPEGHLNTHHRFRHPLLRDFALGLWCLSARDEPGVATRWSEIQGGLQRHGALRAIFEALGDQTFTDEYPHVTRTKIVETLLTTHAESPAHLAQIFGVSPPEPAFDPTTWPILLQQKLPAAFGTDLLAAARLASNAAWGHYIGRWPADATGSIMRFPKHCYISLDHSAKTY